MTPDTVVVIVQRAMEVAAMLAAPMLLSALAIGLLIGMFQAATQINEMTLSFIPKLLILVVAIVVAGNWMVSLLLDYTLGLYRAIPGLLG